jgi:acetolactate synthase-1/2/3 large subunit
MGFAMGAGVSAALRGDGGPTVVIVGDGGFLMNSGELATACQRQARVVYVVANNGSYGTIRLHQEKHYPGRTIATTLTNPDFARLAESFGALGLTASTAEQVRPCLAKALDHDGPSVVEVRTSLRHITAYRLLTSQPQ